MSSQPKPVIERVRRFKPMLPEQSLQSNSMVLMPAGIAPAAARLRRDRALNAMLKLDVPFQPG